MMTIDSPSFSPVVVSRSSSTCEVTHPAMHSAAPAIRILLSCIVDSSNGKYADYAFRLPTYRACRGIGLHFVWLDFRWRNGAIGELANFRGLFHLHYNKRSRIAHCQHRGAAQRVRSAYAFFLTLAVSADCPAGSAITNAVENGHSVPNPDRKRLRLALAWHRKLESFDSGFDQGVELIVTRVVIRPQNDHRMKHVPKELGEKRGIGAPEIYSPRVLAEHLLDMHEMLEFRRHPDRYVDRDFFHTRLRNRRHLHGDGGGAARQKNSGKTE